MNIRHQETYGNILNELPKEFFTYKASYRKVKRKKVRFISKLKNVPCPFLDKNNSCLIYLVRPLTCRLYGYSKKSNRIWGCQKLGKQLTGKTIPVLDTNVYLPVLSIINQGALVEDPIFIWLAKFNDSHQICDPHGFIKVLIEALKDDRTQLQYRLFNEYQRIRSLNNSNK